MTSSNPLVLGIDQSTQGTKALLLDEQGHLIAKCSRPHQQIINEKGYVEHDLNEIYTNVCGVVADLIAQDPSYAQRITCVGLSVQRETVGAWRKSTLEPLYHAIVWQCGRGATFVAQPEIKNAAPYIRETTGLELSEFFSAAKLAWLFDNVPEIRAAAEADDLCVGNIDTFLVHKLTHGKTFATEPSNASRTQLMDIRKLAWDAKLCELFHVDTKALAPIWDSDSDFGSTDFEGVLPQPITIHAAIGDSQGALFGQGCLKSGQTKTTYGTGSSIMMNAGTEVVPCEHGIVNSVGWRRGGNTTYVLEGNINYSAGVISYLKDDLGLISSPAETEELALAANPQDQCYFVPALSGLGAPHFNSDARGTIVGMSRLTTKKELVRAALDSIAYQVNDVVELIRKSSRAATGIDVSILSVDGGATMNRYLMQFQSDLLQLPLKVPADAELSGMGAAIMAGIAQGVYQEEILGNERVKARYEPKMDEATRSNKIEHWHHAVATAIAHGNK